MSCCVKIQRKNKNSPERSTNMTVFSGMENRHDLMKRIGTRELKIKNSTRNKWDVNLKNRCGVFRSFEFFISMSFLDRARVNSVNLTRLSISVEIVLFYSFFLFTHQMDNIILIIIIIKITVITKHLFRVI